MFWLFIRNLKTKIGKILPTTMQHNAMFPTIAPSLHIEFRSWSSLVLWRHICKRKQKSSLCVRYVYGWYIIHLLLWEPMLLDALFINMWNCTLLPNNLNTGIQLCTILYMLGALKLVCGVTLITEDQITNLKCWTLWNKSYNHSFTTYLFCIFREMAVCITRQILSTNRTLPTWSSTPSRDTLTCYIIASEQWTLTLWLHDMTPVRTKSELSFLTRTEVQTQFVHETDHGYKDHYHAHKGYCGCKCHHGYKEHYWSSVHFRLQTFQEKCSAQDVKSCNRWFSVQDKKVIYCLCVQS